MTRYSRPPAPRPVPVPVPEPVIKTGGNLDDRSA